MKHSTLKQDLAGEGIVLKRVHQPRSQAPLVRVLLRAGDSDELAVAATVASLLASACQDFVVDIVEVDEDGHARLWQWLASDSRFRKLPAEGVSLADSVYTLVLHSGTRLGTFSLEALVDALEESGTALLRALVDGQHGAAEFWETGLLTEFLATGDAERAARSSGQERWISGSSVGLHHFRRPAPKMHLRKGAAGRHDLTVVVRDATDPVTKADYEQQLRNLEAKLHKVSADKRRLEAGILPKRGVDRLRAAAGKGPGYLIARTRKVLGRVRNP